MKVLTAIVQDTRREKLNKTYPVKIRITHQRKQVYYPTRFDLSVDDFHKLFTTKPREEYKRILLELTTIENKAKGIIDELKDHFTWNAFEAKFLKKQSDWNSIFSACQDYIDKLRGEDRIGTAVSYECSLNSFKTFTGKEEGLSFEDVTVDFLNKYERWMLKEGNSLTTVGIYLRNIRRIFNLAVKDGIVSKDFYPFGKDRYEIPTGKNIKKALDLTAVGKIYNYECLGEAESHARDFWLFSYFGNGLNIKDIALLKFKNLQGDFIVFERAKTMRSKRSNPIKITIPITDDIRQIISKWGNASGLPEDYLFPILTPGLTATRQRELIQQFTKTVNKYTKRIAANLEVGKEVTTYTARHSYATVLKRSGVSTEFISESLGHSDIKTTQNYLDSFENDHKKEIAKALTAFKHTKDQESHVNS